MEGSADLGMGECPFTNICEVDENRRFIRHSGAEPRCWSSEEGGGHTSMDRGQLTTLFWAIFIGLGSQWRE